MQGPADETDHDIKKNMVRKQGNLPSFFFFLLIFSCLFLYHAVVRISKKKKRKREIDN